MPAATGSELFDEIAPGAAKRPHPKGLKRRQPRETRRNSDKPLFMKHLMKRNAALPRTRRTPRPTRRRRVGGVDQSIRPKWRATATACTRLLMRSFSKMLRRCHLTVFTDTDSRSASPLFESPRETCCRM